MQLYKVPKKTFVQIEDQILFFDHVDGMYSYCISDQGVVHLAAWTEVEIVPKEQVPYDFRIKIKYHGSQQV